MNSLASVRFLSVVAVLFSVACGQGLDLVHVEGQAPAVGSLSPDGGASNLAGDSSPPLPCLPGFGWDDGACTATHEVTLTAIAAATTGLTLYAGAGQQPELRVYVPEKLVTPETNIFVLVNHGANALSANLTVPETDALGTFYRWPLSTLQLPEQTYEVRAWVGADSSGLPSEALTLVVDREPPVVVLTMQNLPAGSVARDFIATAGVNATSHAGFAISNVSVSALGPFVPGPTDRASPWVEFATFTEDDGLPPSVAAVESLVSGAAIPDDTVGLNDDLHSVLVQAVAEDVLGNSASAALLIPVE